MNTQCARTAGAEWPWLKPTEPARVAEVVHRRTKQHPELVHRCEVLRKLQPTSLHSARTLAAAAGPRNDAERRGGGRRAGGEGQGYVACRKEVVHRLHDVGRMDRAVVPVGFGHCTQLGEYCKYGALSVLSFGQ